LHLVQPGDDSGATGPQRGRYARDPLSWPQDEWRREEAKVIERIVVGLDGSATSEAALRYGAELAQRLGVPLHLIQVADISVVRWGASAAAADWASLSSEVQEQHADALRSLETLAGPLRGQGLAVTTAAPTGFAARELIAAVTPRDLLVVGSHGRGGLQRWFIGSVAEEVARTSPAPVLIVRGDRG
jgi:nucleotide-binding universal stress UspA family protein